MTRWYAVHTQAGSELWARSNLWERGIEVYLPRYLKRRRHARRTDWIATPLFPRYLFVRSDLGGGARKSIDTAPGVIRLLCMGKAPSPVADAIIAEIRAREGEDELVKPPTPALASAPKASGTANFQVDETRSVWYFLAPWEQIGN